MKAYTDLEQSKKLTEILPIESADMGWYYSSNPNAARNQMWLGTKVENADIPCWSLSALLEQLKSEIILENKQILFLHLNKYDDNSYEIRYTNSRTGEILIAKADNPVDACVIMIMKLHEQNLI